MKRETKKKIENAFVYCLFIWVILSWAEYALFGFDNISSMNILKPFIELILSRGV